MVWEVKENLQQDYRSSLRSIVEDPEKFALFRVNKQVAMTYEALSPGSGNGYYSKLISNANDWFENNIQEFEKNDLVGNPVRYSFGSTSTKFSTVTLRYLWNTWEIMSNLDVEGKKVVEVGVGYGGLARLVCHFCKPKEYVLIDIPEALELAKLYLGKFELDTKFTFLTPEEATHGDIFIANYSVAELDAAEQQYYLDRTILPSTCGYFTHNVPRPSNTMMSRDNFEKQISCKFAIQRYFEGLPRCEESIVYICKEKT